jgi:plastocyanin
MSLRGGMRMLAVGLLGVLVVVAPEVAGSQAAPSSEGIHAENVGVYAHYWRPGEVSIEPGGSVAISNSTEVPHGVEWIAPPGGHGPSCDPSVPVGNTEAASGTNWSGSCTFTTPGVYTFYCTVHHAAMSGRIVVGTPTTTTTTTTSTPTQTGTTGPTGVEPPTEGVAPSGSSGGSPLVGDVRHAVVLHAAGHGAVIHGTLRVAVAGEDMRLQAEVLARRAFLKGGSGSVRVGHLERSHLHAGAVSFSLVLSTQAARALHKHGHLTVTVRLQLRPLQGRAISIVRSVTLHG